MDIEVSGLDKFGNPIEIYTYMPHECIQELTLLLLETDNIVMVTIIGEEDE